MLNIIGLGYIGLPTALMFASHGVEVVGTDYNPEIIKKLQARELPFEEKGMPELFEDALANDVRFSVDYQVTDKYIIAVPTPFNKRKTKLETKYIVAALNSVLDVCQKNSIIIIESTVSPGTIDKYLRPEITKRGFKLGKDIHLVHAPERIIPGNMVYELVHNSRIIGSDSPEIGKEVKDLYSTFCQGEIHLSSIQSAEMSKVVENTYRDVNIAYANEILKICQESGMDAYEIIRLANLHPRVNILQPGPGVGGHCIPVDPWFLVGDYPLLTNVILASRKVNDSMPEYVIERIYQILQEHTSIELERVGIYGLTYKENVDDTRESPTLQLLEKMKRNLAKPLKVYDPFINESLVENQIFSFDEFLKEIDFVVIMVNHTEILENLDALDGMVILDTKNIYKSEDKDKKIYKL